MNIKINFNRRRMAADCTKIVKAMKAMQDQTGQSQAVCIRKGVINILKALRSRTKQAAKSVPAKDVMKYDGDGPHYITPKGKGMESQRRYTIFRRKPSPDSYRIARPCDSKSQARSKHGKIANWGLARKSWGHAMAVLFARSEGEGNPQAKLRSGLVSGYMKEVVTGKNPRVEVEIENRLNYITDATPPSVLYDALLAAEQSMYMQTEAYVAKAKRQNRL